MASVEHSKGKRVVGTQLLDIPPTRVVRSGCCPFRFWFAIQAGLGTAEFWLPLGTSLCKQLTSRRYFLIQTWDEKTTGPAFFHSYPTGNLYTVTGPDGHTRPCVSKGSVRVSGCVPFSQTPEKIWDVLGPVPVKILRWFFHVKIVLTWIFYSVYIIPYLFWSVVIKS